MKKLLGIVVLGLLIVNNSYSNDRYLSEFEQWLYDNDHHQYLTLNEDNSKYKSNLNIKFYSSWDIPYKSNPNTDTLLYYLFKEITSDNNHGKIGSRGSDTPYEFEFDLRENKYVKKQMQKTALLSYLLYEDGKITNDEITPKDRFGIIFNNDTQWTSASMGKSLVSYVTGHAICEGYIDGVDARLNDWPLLENTLFYDQKLIDLLNMAAGDQRYAGYDLKTNKYSKNPNNNTIKFHMKNGIFKNTKKSKNKYNYSNVISNIVINYVWHKSDGNFQKLLDKIFIEKAKVKNDVWFLRMKKNNVEFRYEVNDEDGPIRYSFRASRYDYLRIAKAMVDDWKNDTCVGKYLKEIYKRKISKNSKKTDPKSANGMSKSYAGFFHTNYKGINNSRSVMGMVGYGGQIILIDFDQGRIIVINSIHTNYNWKKIAHSVIKKGK